MLQEFNSITAQFACEQPLEYVYGVLHYCRINRSNCVMPHVGGYNIEIFLFKCKRNNYHVVKSLKMKITYLIIIVKLFKKIIIIYSIILTQCMVL